MPSISEVLSKHAEHGEAGLLPAVEELVRHGQVAEYLVDLIRRRYPPGEPIVGYRHPNGFSKIRLARLPGYDWTVRLHLWEPDAADSDIHDHRWRFASYVASGSIIECCYEATAGAGRSVMYDCTPSLSGAYVLTNERACAAKQTAESTYLSGSSYQHDASIMHKARAGNDVPAVTVFVQGPAIKSSTTVIRQRASAAQSLPISWLTSSELLDELRTASDLITYA